MASVVKTVPSHFKLLKGRTTVTLSEHRIIMRESSLTRSQLPWAVWTIEQTTLSKEEQYIWKLWTVPIFYGPGNIRKICSSSLYWLVNVIYVYKNQQAQTGNTWILALWINHNFNKIKNWH